MKKVKLGLFGDIRVELNLEMTRIVTRAIAY